MKSLITLLAVAAAAGLILFAVTRDVEALQGFGPAERPIPTARVTRGSIALSVHTSGELRPASAAQLIVPPVRGALQIVRLLPTGTRVEAGDVVVEFDPSEQEYFVEQARSELLQAEQEITRARAEGAVAAAQEEVDLIRARYAVRRAELEVSRNELLSQMDAQKNLLTLEEARRRLEQRTADSASRAAQQAANLAVLEERRNRERLQMMQAERTIQMLQMRSPIRGLVAVKENSEGLMFFFTGMTVPEYREGDLTSSGRTIAEILDTENMEVLARVAESERGNINPGQGAEVHIDARPGEIFRGKVKSISGTARRGQMFGPPAGPSRQFEVIIELDEPPGSTLRPGVTARVTILGEEVRDALLLPRQALFEKDGDPVVYVRQGGAFVPREVQVVHRTESRVAVEGLAEGEEVALVNPETHGKAGPGKSPAGPLTPKANSKGGA